MSEEEDDIAGPRRPLSAGDLLSNEWLVHEVRVRGWAGAVFGGISFGGLFTTSVFVYSTRCCVIIYRRLP